MCRRGYRPSPVTARQKCRGGLWDGPDDVLCEPVSFSHHPKPYIVCPADVTKLLTDTRSTSAYVIFPQPKTNVDWFRCESEVQFKHLFWVKDSRASPNSDFQPFGYSYQYYSTTTLLVLYYVQA